MSSYNIDYGIDGHPIAYNGTPLDKKEILNELNEHEKVMRGLYIELNSYKNLGGDAIKMRGVAEFIHYPKCWDVVAYPTLGDAMKEFYGCHTCGDNEQ